MNHKQEIHNWILQFKPLKICVDMTAGNGHDTYFLALNSNEVIAIDIQEEAINNTKYKCKEFSNIKYYFGNHQNFDIEQRISGLIYNLGYLPGSDKLLITNAQSTISSLNNLVNKTDQFIVISCYRKHPGGNDEYLEVKKWINSLPYEIDILKYETDLSPVTFLVNLTKKSLVK